MDSDRAVDEAIARDPEAFGYAIDDDPQDSRARLEAMESRKPDVEEETLPPKKKKRYGSPEPNHYAF